MQNNKIKELHKMFDDMNTKLDKIIEWVVPSCMHIKYFNMLHTQDMKGKPCPDCGKVLERGLF